MSDAIPAVRSVIVERDIAHPPEKIWRALTQPELIAEWLMQTDFAPVPGQNFRFNADWGGVDCQVQVVEPNKTLAYSWAAFGLDSIVTWTLTATSAGTRLRMEQAGFRSDQDYAFQGASDAWPAYFTAMEQTIAKLA